MDEFFYSSVRSYFHALEMTGHISDSKTRSLLVLLFYYDLLYNDYRGYVKGEDYHVIEKALDCLYGTNCLIPYPDYLKMGKLKLGEMAEVIARIENMAEIHVDGSTIHYTELTDRLDAIESTQVVKGKDSITTVPDIDTSVQETVVEDLG